MRLLPLFEAADSDLYNSMKMDFDNSIEDLKLKLSGYKFNKGENTIRFRDGNSYISVELAKRGDGSCDFTVFCDTKVELSSQSLADPRAAYQTTSARVVKNKSIKQQKEVNSISDVYKIIDDHLLKIKKTKNIAQ